MAFPTEERRANGKRQRDPRGAKASTPGGREGPALVLRAAVFCEEINLEEATAEVVGSLQEAERVMHTLRLTTTVEVLQDMNSCELCQS